MPVKDYSISYRRFIMKESETIEELIRRIEVLERTLKHQDETLKMIHEKLSYFEDDGR
jgi:nitrogen-specific signal transduction histidine kinase